LKVQLSMILMGSVKVFSRLTNALKAFPQYL
jgi:hypothetical protein